jgi:hypothetical protein
MKDLHFLLSDEIKAPEPIKFRLWLLNRIAYQASIFTSLVSPMKKTGKTGPLKIV